MSSLRILILSFFVGLVAFVPAVASAQPDPRAEAKTHYENGRHLFDQGKYQDAIVEFQTADSLAPSGVNDFNIGYAYDQLGDAANAVKYYQSYVTRVPDAKNKASVQSSIERLQQQLAAEAQAQAAADQAAKEEAARKAAEEAARKPPPPPPNGNGAGAPTTTGDPELDRVQAIDVNAIRDQRAATQPVVAANTGGGPSAPPPVGGAPVSAAEAPKKSKPIYKQWWFWVVVGVSAVIVVDLAVSSSHRNGAQPSTGLTIFRF